MGCFKQKQLTETARNMLKINNENNSAMLYMWSSQLSLHENNADGALLLPLRLSLNQRLN